MIGPRPLYRAAALVIAMMAASAALASSAMTRSEACAIIDNRGVNPLSGIWRIGGDGATVAILPVAASSTRFDIYLIDSPDMSVIPGNKIGSAVSTGETGTFDAEMISGQGFTEKRMRYIMTLGQDGRLSFRSYKKGKKISLWRFIPYLFRFSVRNVDTRPESVDGAIKIYPDGQPSGPTLL